MKTWETFWPPHQTPPGEASAVNGISYKRYRVTVEEIDEPDEVIRDRLVDLLSRERVSCHHFSQLRALERRYGFVHSNHPLTCRLATDKDRAKWAEEDRQAEESRQKAALRKEAEKAERNRKARERRQAKKAALVQADNKGGEG